MQVIYRLVEQLEFVSIRRFAKVELEGSASLQTCIHFRLEKPPDSPTIRFGSVQRHVRILQKLFTGGAIARCQRNSYTAPDDNSLPIEFIGFSDTLHNAPSEALSVFGVFGTRLYDRKFVSAQTSNGVYLPYARP